MRKDKFEKLFESLARMSPFLNRVCENALDTVKSDETLEKQIQEEVIASVKALLYHSIELNDYVGRQYPDLDYTSGGKEKYELLKASVEGLIQKKGI